MIRIVQPCIEAVRAVIARPRRCVLLAITAALAVAAMVATRALLTGQVQAITADLRRFGLRTIQVQPSPANPQAEAITGADLEQVRRIGARYGAVVLPAVVSITLLEAGAGTADSPRQAPATPLLGTGAEYLRTLDIDVASGRFFNAEEASAGAAVVVLDASLADTLFARQDCVGEEVQVVGGGARGTYTVVGVLADPLGLRDQFDAFDQMSKARSATARLLAFRNAYVPRARYPGEHISAILVTPDGDGELGPLHDDLERELRAEERGLFVWSRRTWANSLSTMLEEQSTLGNLVWGVVVFVAVITAGTLALLVSADRIAEIAVRRVEGATRLAVFVQFVTEGAIASTAGGAVGAWVGVLAAYTLADHVGLVAVLPRHAAFEAAALAVLVGALGAAIPALRAAFLDPAEALRER